MSRFDLIQAYRDRLALAPPTAEELAAAAERQKWIDKRLGRNQTAKKKAPPKVKPKVEFEDDFD